MIVALDVPADLSASEETYYRSDAAGNQVYAQHADAIVRRSYFRSGALRGDTLQLRDYGTPSYSTSYGLEYAYDVAGRVVSLAHPQNLAGTQTLDRYFYDPTTGALDSLANRQGLAFSFAYDVRGRPTTTVAPGSVRDSVGYDLEGRTAWHRVRNGSGLIVQETMQYDVRSKLVRAENGASVFQQWYSGLGNLVATDWQAIGTLYRNAEEYVIDPLGNVMRTRTADGLNGFDATGSEPRRNLYQGGQARIIETAKVPPAILNTSFNQDSTTQSYDDAGNLFYVYRVASTDVTTGAGTVSETRHYYGGDQRLRALQRVSYSRDSNMTIRQGGVWEEYRYDPLGRRVLVRTRTDGNLCDVDTWTCTGSITRFVWAGDQILWELRAPGNGGTDANLEATTGGGNAYGRVSYSYAGGIDRPLVITKEAVATVIPHQNWRGMFANATTTTGALSQVPVDWPGFQTTPWHEPRSSVQNWFGSVATGMRDASGQIYMRNRYYDPAAGQFTQPDPIGLAGGLNSYGFAAGDPVSHWDPFGLACEKKSAERMVCTDIGPGDFRTISDFIGGESGRSAYSTFESAGLTQWSSNTCRGGFAFAQCSQIAQAQSWLVNSPDRQCSALGTSATRRFQRGHYRYSPFETAWVGLTWPVFSRNVWLAGTAFGPPSSELPNTIAHEEGHLRYWFRFGVQLNWVTHNNGTDFIYKIGEGCASGYPY